MEQFWAFAGNFWWLVFPLAAGVGAVARGWERAARQRHKRRLEVIRAKAELNSAKAAARHTTVARASEPKAITRPQAVPTQLEQLFAKHDDTTARWLEYELDVAKLIAFPAMSDGRQPLTAAFLRAKKIADNLRPESSGVKIKPADLAEYRAAVTDYEVAFDLAERDARRIRDSSFSPAERKRLDTAKQLISVAVDQAATPAERQVAYKRVRDELDGLIALSDEAVEILEKKVALQLESRPPAPDDAG
ncbi:hypothetical protein ACQ143_14000 [Microbacterium sp. MC2]